MKAILLFILFFYSSLLSKDSTSVSISETYKNFHKIDSNMIVEYDSMFFLLGTLSDYMGRFNYSDMNDQIDSYYPFEKPMVDYLTSFINVTFDTNVDTTFAESGHSEMYSSDVAEELNDFYELIDVEYDGVSYKREQLIESEFKNSKHINSFLSGIYYRYGEKIAPYFYKFTFYNSSKYSICYKFLDRIGCDNIYLKSYNNSIPVGKVIYFKATFELKKYFDLIENEKQILLDSYFEIFGRNKNRHDFDLKIIKVMDY